MWCLWYCKLTLVVIICEFNEDGVCGAKMTFLMKEIVDT